MGYPYNKSGDKTHMAGIITATTPTQTTNNGSLFPLSNGDQMSVTAADITAALASLLALQDVNEVKRDVFEAAGEVKVRIGEASTANLVSTLQSQISNLQGQSGLAQDIAKVSTETALGLGIVNTNVSNQAGILGVNVVNATAGTNNLVSVATNLLNTNLLQGNYQTQSIIREEAEKTRAKIDSYEIAGLNRQIVVTENRLTEALGDVRATAAGVNVTTTVNQAQAQQQQQQQLVANNTLLTSLLSEVQRNTQSVVNLGTMTSSPQNATNVKA